LRYPKLAHQMANSVYSHSSRPVIYHTVDVWLLSATKAVNEKAINLKVTDDQSMTNGADHEQSQ